jgi:hypothetical protein
MLVVRLFACPIITSAFRIGCDIAIPSHVLDFLLMIHLGVRLRSTDEDDAQKSGRLVFFVASAVRCTLAWRRSELVC